MTPAGDAGASERAGRPAVGYTYRRRNCTGPALSRIDHLILFLAGAFCGAAVVGILFVHVAANVAKAATEKALAHAADLVRKAEHGA